MAEVDMTLTHLYDSRESIFSGLPTQTYRTINGLNGVTKYIRIEEGMVWLLHLLGQIFLLQCSVISIQQRLLEYSDVNKLVQQWIMVRGALIEYHPRVVFNKVFFLIDSQSISNILANSPSGCGFIMMVHQRLRVFQVHHLLIPTDEPHKFLGWTKYAMFLSQCTHQGLPRWILFSFVVRKEFWHC